MRATIFAAPDSHARNRALDAQLIPTRANVTAEDAARQRALREQADAQLLAAMAVRT